MNETDQTLTALIKTHAHRLGFAEVGVCAAVTTTGLAKLHEWLGAGYAGEMDYLAHRAEAYSHPQHVLDGAKSLVMLAMNYRTADPVTPPLGYGRVSRYAWGGDYHDLVRQRLKSLCEFIQRQAPQSAVRGVIDTAPLLEREFAQLAGLGWIGKNTLLLNRRQGSWFFLAALLTDLELDYDDPHTVDHCGTCTACLDACPTGAFVASRVLDSRRCISYLTIELRGQVPDELRAGMGEWLFGCDVCQEVCPWNHKSPGATETHFQPADGMNPLHLESLFDLDEAAFRRRFRGTPLWRAKRRGLLRSAAIVLGNQQSGLAALSKGLADCEPLVREACAWALGKFSPRGVAQLLSDRLGIEDDQAVRDTIKAALDSFNTGNNQQLIAARDARSKDGPSAFAGDNG